MVEAFLLSRKLNRRNVIIFVTGKLKQDTQIFQSKGKLTLVQAVIIVQEKVLQLTRMAHHISILFSFGAKPDDIKYSSEERIFTLAGYAKTLFTHFCIP